MLDLETRARKAGTVTVPLLLPKNNGYVWFTGFIFHSSELHLYVAQKEIDG